MASGHRGRRGGGSTNEPSVCDDPELIGQPWPLSLPSCPSLAPFHLPCRALLHARLHWALGGLGQGVFGTARLERDSCPCGWGWPDWPGELTFCTALEGSGTRSHEAMKPWVLHKGRGQDILYSNINLILPCTLGRQVQDISCRPRTTVCMRKPGLTDRHPQANLIWGAHPDRRVSLLLGPSRS
jgi:hypothetical protein